MDKFLKNLFGKRCNRGLRFIEKESFSAQHDRGVRSIMYISLWQLDMQHGRCERELEDDVKKKIGMFSQLTCDKIISVHDVSEIYKVPLLLKSQNVAEIISNKLEMYLPKVSASNPTASVFVFRSCACVCALPKPHLRFHMI